MKKISEKNYCQITIVAITIIVLASLIVVRALNRSTADELSDSNPHLPETVTIDSDLNATSSLDQIDIFAKEDSQ